MPLPAENVTEDATLAQEVQATWTPDLKNKITSMVIPDSICIVKARNAEE